MVSRIEGAFNKSPEKKTKRRRITVTEVAKNVELESKRIKKSKKVRQKKANCSAIRTHR